MNSSIAKAIWRRFLVSVLLALHLGQVQRVTADEVRGTVQEFAEGVSAAHPTLIVGVEFVPGLDESFKQPLGLAAAKDLESFVRLLREETAYEALIGKDSVWILPKESELEAIASLKTKTPLAKRVVLAKATKEPSNGYEVIRGITSEDGAVALLPMNGVVSPSGGTIDINKVSITIPNAMSVSVAEILAFLTSQLGAKLCFVTHSFEESAEGKKITLPLTSGYVEFR